MFSYNKRFKKYDNSKEIRNRRKHVLKHGKTNSELLTLII